jgi:uncharacterized protein (TIGR03118 family)
MRKNFTQALYFAFIIFTSTILFSCQKNMRPTPDTTNDWEDSKVTPKDFKDFVQLNLVGANTAARTTDVNLVNAIGIEFSPSGVMCVASAGKGRCNNYNLDGLPVGDPVIVPSAIGGYPTGHTINPTLDFKLPNNEPAQYIYATSDGTISGWNGEKGAIIKINNSSNASYTGITMANIGADFFIYASNFAQNRIDVFDKNWNPVNISFTDPDLPSGYSPFNIETLIDGRVYVVYAKKNLSGKAEAGPGNGYVNVFSPDGTLLKHFVSKGKLNKPWGITKAPGGFWGEWSQINNLILVANNGDGHINVFDEDGNFISTLYLKGKAVVVDGLWGITFPPITGFNRYYMYFSAGPNNGTGGLVGYIKNAYLN